MNAASSLKRKTTELAMSLGSPSRASGVWRMNPSRVAGSSVSGDAVSVLIRPGSTEFTRMPCSPHSSAATFVSMSTPAFDAEYADSQRPLRAPATELMLTMLPPPASRIASASACID